MSTPVIPSEPIQQFTNHKVKLKEPYQRACNEKDAKGKICAGHLKRWAFWKDVLEQQCGDLVQAWGERADVFRCEHCKTLYLPNPTEPKVNNAGRGTLSEYGLTIVPKTDQPGTNAQATGAGLEKKVKEALPQDAIETPSIQPGEK